MQAHGAEIAYLFNLLAEIGGASNVLSRQKETCERTKG